MDIEVEVALRRAALWDEVKDCLSGSGLALSDGQQQRLSIARTIAVKPEAILLDEPCSAIDPISSAKIEHTIDELKQDHTIIIVTHNLQHNVATDGPLVTKVRERFVGRLPVYERGVANILFAISKLKTIEADADYRPGWPVFESWLRHRDRIATPKEFHTRLKSS